MNREKNIERAIRNARVKIRRLIMSSGLDYLLTLTYRENMCDFEKACDDLREFAERVQQVVPGWKYLAVSERQERGAYHWHIAVKGWQSVVLLREIWKQVVGEGNIDIKSPKVGKRARWGRLGLAYYLAKYIGKDIGDVELNRHNYRRSRGLEKPEIIKVGVETGLNFMAWVEEMFKNSGCRLVKVWHHESGLFGWACSWDLKNY
jgi:hypothetical protein